MAGVLRDGIITDEKLWQDIGEMITRKVSDKQVKFEKCIRGGMVNQSAVYSGENRKYFVKYNDVVDARNIFESEYESLKAIAATNTIRVPEPLMVLDYPRHNGHILVEEYFENLQSPKNCWAQLGQEMARMHSHNIVKINQLKMQEKSVHKKDIKAVESFGFPYNSYCGNDFHVQAHQWASSWQEYFSVHFMKQIFDRIEKKFNDHEVKDLWAELQLKLDKAFNGVEIFPSLLHGDFAEVNVGSVDNQPVVFDTGCLYGHWQYDFAQCLGFEFDLEEMDFDSDISLETLDGPVVGQFPEEFFKSYHSIIPKQAKFDERMELYHMFGYRLCYFYGLSGMKDRLLKCGNDYLKMVS